MKEGREVKLSWTLFLLSAMFMFLRHPFADWAAGENNNLYYYWWEALNGFSFTLMATAFVFIWNTSIIKKLISEVFLCICVEDTIDRLFFSVSKFEANDLITILFIILLFLWREKQNLLRIYYEYIRRTNHR